MDYPKENQLKNDDTKIISLHNQGFSVTSIYYFFNKKHFQKDIAGVIARSEMTIDDEKSFFIVPSKMNYDFRLKA